MQRVPVRSIKDVVHKVARSDGWRVKKGSITLFADQRRHFSSNAADEEEKIVAAVVLERLPVVLPPLAPAVAAFQQFSFDWRQQFRRHYPQEFLDQSTNRGESDENSLFEPAPTVTEADRANDQRSLERALDQRLYLILHGLPSGNKDGKSVWHFPEKLYSKEPSLRQCAETALGSVIGDLSKSVYFVGNAPCGQLPSPPVKRFFFRSQLLTSELQFEDKKHEDFAWIKKEEVPLYFEPIQAEFLKKLLH